MPYFRDSTYISLFRQVFQPGPQVGMPQIRPIDILAMKDAAGERKDQQAECTKRCPGQAVLGADCLRLRYPSLHLQPAGSLGPELAEDRLQEYITKSLFFLIQPF